MASMRVHELAKEFDMSSGDLLDRLKEMKIPAKSHASMLNDAYVDKIRKNLEPEIRARAGALEAEEAAALAAEQEEAERKRAEEEAERKAAREKELAEREAARARREGSRSDDDAEGEEHQAPKQAPKQPSAFASLEQQIASEKERVEREKAEARARARAAKAAAEASEKVQHAFEVLGDNIPDNLRQAGQLRIDHVDKSLEELGKIAEPQITKDAIAGRIRRLLQLAEKTEKARAAEGK